LFRLQNLIGVAHNSVRFRSGLPINTVILFVPQQEAWVIERFGKFYRVLEPVSRVNFHSLVLPSAGSCSQCEANGTTAQISKG